MRLRFSRQTNQGLTLIEAVVVIFILAFITLLLVPALLAPRYNCGPKTACANNLKQLGLAYLVWAGDNNDRLPMDVSVTNGGARELVTAGNAVAVFQVMSNELSTPKFLICRSDDEHSYTTNFGSGFTAKNISYFVGLDANTNFPQSFLSGDDNFESEGKAITSGPHMISTDKMYYWSPARHDRTGNLLLMDGSVQEANNLKLKKRVALTGLATNRLIIP